MHAQVRDVPPGVPPTVAQEANNVAIVRDATTGVDVSLPAIGATPTLKLLSWQQIMVKNVSVPGNCTLTTPLLVTSTEGLTPERCVTSES